MKLLNFYKYLGTLCFISLGLTFHQKILTADCNEKNCLLEKKYFLHKKLNKDYTYKSHFSDIEDLKKVFNSIVKKNDIVFIKGSRKMKLERVYS